MIWLIGAKGMLGQEVARALEEARLPFVSSDAEVDITDIDALEQFASAACARAGASAHHKLDYIINCAAYTDVDKAEDEPARAEALNVTGPAHIARVARANGATLIHISTDYVFDGSATEPYREEAAKSPLGVYGKTKSDGEDAVAKEMTKFYILRTSWLYGLHGCNFVYTMLKNINSKDEVSVVQDQRGTPTNCTTLAAVILELVQVAARGHFVPFGIYHVTDEGGAVSWYDFAKEIQRLGCKHKRISHDCTLQPCTSADFPRRAMRPSYSVLDKTKLPETLHIKLPKWQKSLEAFIKAKEFEVK